MYINHKIKFQKPSLSNNRIISHPIAYNKVSCGLPINKYTIYNYEAISQIKFLFDKALSR